MGIEIARFLYVFVQIMNCNFNSLDVVDLCNETQLQMA